MATKLDGGEGKALVDKIFFFAASLMHAALKITMYLWKHIVRVGGQFLLSSPAMNFIFTEKNV